MQFILLLTSIGNYFKINTLFLTGSKYKRVSCNSAAISLDNYFIIYFTYETNMDARPIVHAFTSCRQIRFTIWAVLIDTCFTTVPLLSPDQSILSIPYCSFDNKLIAIIWTVLLNGTYQRQLIEPRSTSAKTQYQPWQGQ